MTPELNPHHVVHFPLHELGTFPDANHGIYNRRVFRDPDLDHDPVPSGNGVQDIDHFKSLRIHGIVYGSDINDIIVAIFRFIMQSLEYFQGIFGTDIDRQVAQRFPGSQESFRKTFFK
jgi:hypothetical protein